MAGNRTRALGLLAMVCVVLIGHVSNVDANGDDKLYIVTSILEEPYVMSRRSDGAPLVGNARFEGYLVDMMEELAHIMGISYVLRMVEDGKYGSMDANGTWNGMIREVMDGKADMSLAALTITAMRERVVDISKPYMSTGIGMLIKRPIRQPSSPPMRLLFAPFSIGVWLCIIASFVAVSLLFFVFARFLPSSKADSGEAAIRKERAGKTIPSCLDSFWWTGRSLLFQGFSGDRSPTSIAVRILAMFWFVFVLLSILLYLVSLNNIYPAYRTTERPRLPIESVSDLAKQTKIKYGTIAGSSTMTFFKASKVPVYERMWSFMSSTEPSVFVRSTQEGISRVQKGGYVYIGESNILTYTTSRQCDMQMVGGLLSSTGYGLTFPIGSPLRDTVSQAILQLQEDGKLQQLYNKWWFETSICEADEDTKKTAAVCERQTAGYYVDVDVFSGPLVLMVIGVLLALIAAAVEIIVARSLGQAKDPGGKRFSSSDQDKL